MSKNLKRVLYTGLSALMLASVGAPAFSSVNVSARRVHSARYVKRYNHKRNIHRYNRARIHYIRDVHKYHLSHRRNSIRDLERQLGLMRYREANAYLKNTFYPKYDEKKGASFFNGESGGNNGYYDETQGAYYFQKEPYIQHYIKGLTDYLNSKYGNENETDDARMAGQYDANMYATRLVTERYARTHHMSKTWLKKNLSHYVNDYGFGEAGLGYNNFMTGVEFARLYDKNEIKGAIHADGKYMSNQWKIGAKYAYGNKAKYYQLRHPNYNELNWLKNHYANRGYTNVVEE